MESSRTNKTGKRCRKNPGYLLGSFTDATFPSWWDVHVLAGIYGHVSWYRHVANRPRNSRHDSRYREQRKAVPPKNQRKPPKFTAGKFPPYRGTAEKGTSTLETSTLALTAFSSILALQICLQSHPLTSPMQCLCTSSSSSSFFVLDRAMKASPTGAAATSASTYFSIRALKAFARPTWFPIGEHIFRKRRRLTTSKV